MRLMVPFFVALPVTVVADVLLRRASLAQHTMDPTYAGQGEWLGRPLHLWFLEYLLVLYVLALALRAPLLRLPGIVARIDRAFRRALGFGLRWWVFRAIIFPSLGARRFGWIDDPGGFVPEPRIVLAYAIFFAFGWLLWRQADLLAVLARPKPIIASFALGVAATERLWMRGSVLRPAAWPYVLALALAPLTLTSSYEAAPWYGVAGFALAGMAWFATVVRSNGALRIGARFGLTRERQVLAFGGVSLSLTPLGYPVFAPEPPRPTPARACARLPRPARAPIHH